MHCCWAVLFVIIAANVLCVPHFKIKKTKNLFAAFPAARVLSIKVLGTQLVLLLRWCLCVSLLHQESTTGRGRQKDDRSSWCVEFQCLAAPCRSLAKHLSGAQPSGQRETSSAKEPACQTLRASWLPRRRLTDDSGRRRGMIGRHHISGKTLLAWRCPIKTTPWYYLKGSVHTAVIWGCSSKS